MPKMDWQQVVLNGGPPCFAVLDDEPEYYCGRAERWEGHDGDHEFVSLESLLRRVTATPPDLTGRCEAREDHVYAVGFRDGVILATREEQSRVHWESGLRYDDYSEEYKQRLAAVERQRVESLHLMKASPITVAATPPNLAEQARQLVSKWDSEVINAQTTIVIPTAFMRILAERVASFAAEAATQGQAVGIELAASYLDPVIAARCTCNGTRNHGAGCEAWSLVPIQNGIRAFSPESDYLDRVRNEARIELEVEVRSLKQQNGELKTIIEMATDDDPGTALSKLRKIQHEAATAALEQAWMPIQTAPKTGEQILLGHGNSVWEDEWWAGDEANWLECVEGGKHEGETPSHWMPLPQPPIAAIGDDKEHGEHRN